MKLQSLTLINHQYEIFGMGISYMIMTFSWNISGVLRNQLPILDSRGWNNWCSGIISEYFNWTSNPIGSTITSSDIRTSSSTCSVYANTTNTCQLPLQSVLRCPLQLLRLLQIWSMRELVNEIWTWIHYSVSTAGYTVEDSASIAKRQQNLWGVRVIVKNKKCTVLGLTRVWYWKGLRRKCVVDVVS